MAIKANLVIDQGTSFSATIDLTEADDAVFNLTGYTVAAQMRKNYASSTATTFKDLGFAITESISALPLLTNPLALVTSVTTF